MSEFDHREEHAHVCHHWAYYLDICFRDCELGFWKCSKLSFHYE